MPLLLPLRRCRCTAAAAPHTTAAALLCHCCHPCAAAAVPLLRLPLLLPLPLLPRSCTTVPLAAALLRCCTASAPPLCSDASLPLCHCHRLPAAVLLPLLIPKLLRHCCKAAALLTAAVATFLTLRCCCRSLRRCSSAAAADLCTTAELQLSYCPKATATDTALPQRSCHPCCAEPLCQCCCCCRPYAAPLHCCPL